MGSSEDARSKEHKRRAQRAGWKILDPLYIEQLLPKELLDTINTGRCVNCGHQGGVDCFADFMELNNTYAMTPKGCPKCKSPVRLRSSPLPWTPRWRSVSLGKYSIPVVIEMCLQHLGALNEREQDFILGLHRFPKLSARQVAKLRATVRKLGVMPGGQS